MGRRSGGDGTRERVLQASLPLFARHGYAGTSTRAIAQAAEVNVATIAYHFGDKEGLYHTVVQRLHEDLADTPWPERLPVGSPAELLAWVVGEAWAFAVGHRDHIRLLQRHVLDRGRLPQVVLDRWAEPLLRRAEDLVGLFRPEWSSTRRRLLALSAMHLLARFAIEDEAQLARMLPETPDPAAAVREALVDQLTAALGLG